jgi:hypothetical protein
VQIKGKEQMPKADNTTVKLSSLSTASRLSQKEKKKAFAISTMMAELGSAAFRA